MTDLKPPPDHPPHCKDFVPYSVRDQGGRVGHKCWTCSHEFLTLEDVRFNALLAAEGSADDGICHG